MNRSAKQKMEQGIGYKVRLLSQLLSRRIQTELVPFGLTPYHYFVLRCLWEEDGLPVSAIANRMQELGGTMTGVIDRMEERGLLARKRDKLDRRIWRVFLTEKGRHLEDELPSVLAKVRRQLLKGIDKGQYDVFDKVLDQLLDNAAQLVNDSQPLSNS
jgi:DNA-binding MarR family transcriptional regulator